MSEKQQEFHKTLVICSDIEAEIAESEARTKALKAKLAQAEAEREAKASDAAEERHAGGFILLPMPDGTSCAFGKAKRRKGGEEPKNKFVVRHNERYGSDNRRIQNTNEENEDTNENR